MSGPILMPTPEEIAQHYSAAMDSVNLINALMAQDSRTTEEQDTVSRNVEHLQIMVAKDFWTTEDLTPLNNAITAGS
jgi:dihydrodipicolinate synthase/N-acetylneuraminate lyase|tara:strand:+ start:1397 stop:1627 length:231 start_codon:yes stop_codon:yes gene_type:complete